MSRSFCCAAFVLAFVLVPARLHAGAATATLDVDDGGGKGGCTQDVKNVDASSTCLRATWCGGASGGTITYGALKVGSPAGGSIDCCLTEVVIPAHTEIIAGNKRIVHVTDVDGFLITRRCSSPFVFLWIEFGSWTCELDSLTKLGKFPIDSAQSCD
jgi:hypothetical protein